MQGRYWLVVVSMVALAACEWKQPNSHRCPGGEHCQPDAREGDQCGAIKCKAPTPVCELDTMSCVECVEDADCAASRPFCDARRTCVQCQAHDQCLDSALCLDGGTCAAREDVAYVGGANATPNTSCTKDVPCQTLTQALTPAMPRRYIKITGAIVDGGVTIDGKRVDIYGGAGAQLSRAVKNEVLIIKGTSQVHLIDLEIVGNVADNDKNCIELSGAAAVTLTRSTVRTHAQAGISLAGTARLVLNGSRIHDNAKEGVKAAAGTRLELNRSSIYRNAGTAGVYAVNAAMVTIDSSVIATNIGTAGGVSITGPFSIRNSIIAANGNVSTTILAGGLNLSPGAPANARFEFNTVADNSSSSGVGLTCNTVRFEVSSSILTGNKVSNCDVSYSLMSADDMPTGTNKTGDAIFVSKTLLDPMFYRIDSLSAARDSADPAATLEVDIDGQPRDDGRKDMGADEYK
jgi:hypothetical protein